MILLNPSYTGVTCDPDEFEEQNYVLRQNLSGRETELAICITMYNVNLHSVLCSLSSLTD